MAQRRAKETEPAGPELLRRVAARDEAAVEAFYDAHAQDLFSYIYRRVGEVHEDAEEITQDILISAVALAGTFNGSCKISTWLCSIGQLKLVDYYRRQDSRKRIPAQNLLSLDDERLQNLGDDDLDSRLLERVIDRLDAQETVQGMMAALNPDEREAMMLRYGEQFTVAEIAGLLQRTEKAVEHLLQRAKKKAAAAVAARIAGGVDSGE